MYGFVEILTQNFTGWLYIIRKISKVLYIKEIKKWKFQPKHQ